MSDAQNTSVGEPFGSDRSRDLIGTVLEGKIQILSMLASGASADVYKAQHRALDYIVTVKVLNSLVKHFLQYAEEKHSHREVSNSFYQKASMLIDSGKTKEADRMILKMKKASDDGVSAPDFNEDEYARYCELLNRRGRYLETLRFIESKFPHQEGHLVDFDKQSRIWLRLYEAAAHLGLGEARTSALMAKQLVADIFVVDQNLGFSDNVELVLLRSYEKQARNDLLIPELKGYLNQVQVEAPNRYFDSVAFLNRNFLERKKDFDARPLFSWLIDKTTDARRKVQIESEYLNYLNSRPACAEDAKTLAKKLK